MTEALRGPRSIPAAPRAAALTWLAWSCGAIGAVLIFVRFALESGTAAPDALALSSIVLPLAFPALGALLASRRPRHPIGWLFLVMAIAWGLADAAGAYGQSGSPDPALASLVGRLGGWPNYAGVGALMLILLLFPDGRPPSRRWRPVAWLIGAYTAPSVVLVAVAPDTAAVLQPLGLPLLVAAASSLVLRFIRATGLERQQLKWLVAASALVIPVLLVTVALDAFPHDP